MKNDLEQEVGRNSEDKGEHKEKQSLIVDISIYKVLLGLGLVIAILIACCIASELTRKEEVINVNDYTFIKCDNTLYEVVDTHGNKLLYKAYEDLSKYLLLDKVTLGGNTMYVLYNGISEDYFIGFDRGFNEKEDNMELVKLGLEWSE